MSSATLRLALVAIVVAATAYLYVTLAQLLDPVGGELVTRHAHPHKRSVTLYLFMTRLFLLAFFLFGASTAVPAAEVFREDALAIRAVIAEQLDAFAHDDAPRAFSLATTTIQAQFGTPEVFINMVRSAYPVVYRSKTVQFDKPVVVEGEVIQPVRMTDAEGRAFIALYSMQRQADGGWRINGCQLARLSGLEV